MTTVTASASTRPLRTTLDPLHAVVPVRTLAGGKARLGEALDAEEREELVLGMLTHTLSLLAAWTPCVRVHVVTPDPTILRLVATPTVSTIAQTTGGLNEGLRSGWRPPDGKAPGRCSSCLPTCRSWSCRPSTG